MLMLASLLVRHRLPDLFPREFPYGGFLLVIDEFEPRFRLATNTMIGGMPDTTDAIHELLNMAERRLMILETARGCRSSAETDTAKPDIVGAVRGERFLVSTDIGGDPKFSEVVSLALLASEGYLSQDDARAIAAISGNEYWAKIEGIWHPRVPHHPGP